MDNQLTSALENKKWSYKLTLYNISFESIQALNPVNAPEISVIIVSWRKHEFTLRNLKRLQYQKRKINFEIIFVNNGANKNEFLEFKPFVDKYITLNNNTGACISRNIGAIFSEAPILLFLEDDCFPDQDLVLSHKISHKRYDPYSVRGGCFPLSSSQYNNYQTHYYRGDLFFPMYSDLEGNSSYNASVFFEVGGWDDDLRIGHEGKLLALKIWNKYPERSKQIYSPISIIYHDYATSQQHLESKLALQKESLELLLEKNPRWNEFNVIWDFMRNKDINMEILDSQTWNNDHEFRKCFSIIQNRVLARNEKVKRAYMRGKIFFHDVSSFEELREKKSLSIFGTGFFGSGVYSILKEKNIQVNTFLDNDSTKWGANINSIPIISPSNIDDSFFILISSSWHFEISQQLKDLGLIQGENFVTVI